jgi:hypothetical protein
MNIINLIYSDLPDADNYFLLSHKTENEDSLCKTQNKNLQHSVLQQMESIAHSDTIKSIEDACIMSRRSAIYCIPESAGSDCQDGNPDKSSYVSCFYRLLQTIPVYVVTTEMSGKIISLPSNKTENIEIPNCHELIHLDKNLSEALLPKRFEEFKRQEKIDIKQDFEHLPPYHKTRDGKLSYEIFDFLGMYQCKKSGDKSDYWDISNFHPQIFIWIDNIYEEISKKEGHGNPQDFYLLFAQVVFHELMHALMDCYDETTANPGIDRIFSLEEEPIAEALSIKLMKKEWQYTDCCNRDLFKERIRPWLYYLYKVYDEDESLLTALTAWIIIKTQYDYIDKDLLIRWLKCMDKDNLEEAYSEELEDAENVIREIVDSKKLKNYVDPIKDEKINNMFSILQDCSFPHDQPANCHIFIDRFRHQYLKALTLKLALSNQI